MTQKTHDFKIDQNILYSIIAKQAGTLQKAFLELAMNSIDAGATSIKIEFNGREFSFYDDGKGFENEEEIHKFFGTFGTPHDEGDAIYGKFRMGRGQIMAFAKNQWQSNTFFMDVDIKNRGIKYDFESHREFLDGCKITGTLYEELEPYEVKEFEKEFKEFIKFSQIPIYLNDELISENLDAVKWDIVTDDAYMQIDNKRNLTVYNLGVKVREYTGWDIGFGGIVVSKKPLEVNFARNDILRKSCPVWKNIQKEINALLKERSAASVNKNTNLTDGERAVMSRKFITGEIAYIEGRRLKLFTDVQGRHHTLTKLLSCKKITVSDKYNRIGNKVHERGISFVLDDGIFENFGVKTIEELLKALREQCYNSWKGMKHGTKDSNKVFKDMDTFKLERLIVEDIEEFKEQINTSSIRLDKKDLLLKQQLTLDILNKQEKKIRNLLNRYCQPKARKREIIAGESELAEAWTDGETYIAISKELLNLGTLGTPGFTKLVEILLHEYIHRDNDLQSHSHDFVFYKIFHEVSQHHLSKHRWGFINDEGNREYSSYLHNDKDSLGYIAFTMTKSYFALLEKNQIRIPQGAMTLSTKAYNQLFR